MTQNSFQRQHFYVLKKEVNLEDNFEILISSPLEFLSYVSLFELVTIFLNKFKTKLNGCFCINSLSYAHKTPSHASK